MNFDLWFNQPIDAEEAERQLVAGINEAGNTGLVISTFTIQITGDTLRSQLSLEILIHSSSKNEKFSRYLLTLMLMKPQGKTESQLK